jgi:pimeloyl-ACP methyl ester carboxylesterase
MASQIYIFSGLGADERVFQRLDFSGYEVTFIKWIRPEKNETIEGYSVRIREQIQHSKPILIGLSFGGMIALEVAKLIETEKIVLISSAKTKAEIPWYYRHAGGLGIHKLLPSRLLKNSNFITHWFFGAQSTFDKNLLRQILHETDPVFLKWAIDKIVGWENETVPENVFHIHGANDKILAKRYIHCNEVITEGGHFMVLNNAEMVNTFIRKHLQNPF